MKLLICTQAVDRSDPILGFFHRWIEEFSKYFESVVVICLWEGEHSLPHNVRVFSLGKEHKKAGKVLYALRFLRHVWRLRRQYDVILVHMNQEYILLAGWLWRLLGKKVFMWRNHYSGNFLTARAVRQCKKVFFTSQFSYTARFPHAVRMPVGIDTEKFDRMPDIPRDPQAILFLARIAPSKKPHLFLQALAILARRDVQFSASIYGSALPSDEAYRRELQHMSSEWGLEERVRFYPGIPNHETPAVFNRHGIFVNCSPSGMYDKTIFEAAACECLVMASSKDFAEIVDPQFIFKEDNAEDLADKLSQLLKLPLLERQGMASALRNVAKDQSIETLGKRLYEIICAE